MRNWEWGYSLLHSLYYLLSHKTVAKKIKTTLKLQLEAGKANPSPSLLRSSLKPIGFNISATGKLPFSRPFSHVAGF
ncbi:MAG: hypothetical protein NUV53_04065 [Patescibacteria group bacterium]|nr:hypothetical protein [Patescibacteria group bacterium]